MTSATVSRGVETSAVDDHVDDPLQLSCRNRIPIRKGALIYRASAFYVEQCSSKVSKMDRFLIYVYI